MTTIDVKVGNAVRNIPQGEGLDRHYRKVAMHVNGTYYTATANAKTRIRHASERRVSDASTPMKPGPVEANWLAATATPAHFPTLSGGHQPSKTGKEKAVPSQNFLFSEIPLPSFQWLSRFPATKSQEFLESLSPPSESER